MYIVNCGNKSCDFFFHKSLFLEGGAAYNWREILRFKMNIFNNYKFITNSSMHKVEMCMNSYATCWLFKK